MRRALKLLLAFAALAFATAQVPVTQATWSAADSAGVSAGYAADFAPLNTAVPTVTGTLSLLSSLTATPGTWGNSNVAPTFGYQWQYCADALIAACVDIPGETAVSYTISLLSLQPILGILGGLPVNAHFRVIETATNPWGSHSAASVIL